MALSLFILWSDIISTLAYILSLRATEHSLRILAENYLPHIFLGPGPYKSKSMKELKEAFRNSDPLWSPWLRLASSLAGLHLYSKE